MRAVFYTLIVVFLCLLGYVDYTHKLKIDVLETRLNEFTIQYDLLSDRYNDVIDKLITLPGGAYVEEPLAQQIVEPEPEVKKTQTPSWYEGFNDALYGRGYSFYNYNEEEYNAGWKVGLKG